MTENSQALLSEAAYRIKGIEQVLTPALAIYAEKVEANIATTLRLLGDDPDRWRPHVKTAKLGCIMRRLVERGVTHFKCATTLELTTAIEAGASDILLAYPAVGANARRVQEIADQFPALKISALIEDLAQIRVWVKGRTGLFIDINPGMHRTGIEQERSEAIVRLAQAIVEAGLSFRGLHYYDGHLNGFDLRRREALAHRGYDRLMEIVAALSRAGIPVPEVITAGTPTFPCTLSYLGFVKAPFVHRASPGTVVYCDTNSLAALPQEYSYRPAALVVSTVVSHPAPSRFTCDAGHKTVSADAGVPTCTVLGHPQLRPQSPSEEHLPIEVPPGAQKPAIGELLYLIPRHICPTVNNFDHALIVSENRIVTVERVTSRGREAPLRRDNGCAAMNWPETS